MCVWRDRQGKLAVREAGVRLESPFLASPRSPRLRNPDQLRRGERYPQCTMSGARAYGRADRREQRDAVCGAGFQPVVRCRADQGKS